MSKRKALVLNNNETLSFEEVELNGEEITYEFLHDMLGWIEHLAGYNETLDNNHISIWCDEEFKLKEGWQDRASIVIVSKKGELIDVLAGTLIFCIDSPDGNTYGLTDEQITIVKNELSKRRLIVNNRLLYVLDYKA